MVVKVGEQGRRPGQGAAAFGQANQLAIPRAEESKTASRLGQRGAVSDVSGHSAKSVDVTGAHQAVHRGDGAIRRDPGIHEPCQGPKQGRSLGAGEGRGF